MTQKQPLKSLLLRLLTITALCILSTAYAVAADDQLSLDDAIEQSVEELSVKLNAGTRVAIVAFEAENDNIAGYVMDELTGAFVNSRSTATTRA
ncbi:MAG: hypothetical protein Ta2F_12600 [Termitinemataceae bacterium]|nr:MAG: hypothetical protein Ta2F_12600 [Termitinemataceae bacterium]